MLSPNAETPAIRDFADNGRPEFEMLGGSPNPEYATSLNFQAHRPLAPPPAGTTLADLSTYRAAFLGRRFGLAPGMAAIVALLVFEGRAAQ